MEDRLSDARDQTRLSRLEVESQRAYLEAVLERISTGVLTLDAEGALRTANAASTRILGVDLAPLSGQPLSELAAEHAALGQVLSVVMPHVERGGGEWREEVELPECVLLRVEDESVVALTTYTDRRALTKQLGLA